VIAPWSAAAAQEPAAPAVETAASSVLPELEWSERLAELLLMSRADTDRERETTTESLAGLGALAAPALLDGALEGRLRRVDADTLRLEDVERAVLRAAALRLGEGALLALARETAAQADQQLDARATLRALEALALCGHGRELDLALELALGVDPAGSAAARAQRGLERAASEICARDASALRDLDALLEGVPETAALALLRGVAGCGRASALSALVDVLPRRPELALSILAELPRAAASAELPVDDWLLASVRAHLDANSIAEQRAAVRACGELEDFASAPALIGLLQTSDEGLRADAAAALAQLAGLSYGLDPTPWSSWVVRERRWFAADVPRLARELGSPVLGRVMGALRELGEHRYRRHDLARIVQRSLEDPEVPVRLTAIAGLRALGSRSAVPALIVALDDPDPRVTRAARSCLVELTGEELGPQRRAWDQRLVLRG